MSNTPKQEDLFDLMDAKYLDPEDLEDEELYDDEFDADEWYERAENEDYYAQFGE